MLDRENKEISDETQHEASIKRARSAEADRDAEELGEAFINDSDTSNAFSKLARYETTTERGLLRAMHELQRLQAARAGQTGSSACCSGCRCKRRSGLSRGRKSTSTLYAPAVNIGPDTCILIESRTAAFSISPCVAGREESFVRGHWSKPELRNEPNSWPPVSRRPSSSRRSPSQRSCPSHRWLSRSETS